MRFIGNAVVLLSYFPLLFKCKLSYYSHKLVSILVNSLTGVHIIFTMWNYVTLETFLFPILMRKKRNVFFFFEEATNL